jgi:MFS family permease
MNNSPLQHPVYRRLFAAQVIALAGTGLTTVALALLAYDLGGGNAGAILGTAFAIKMVAYVGVAPIISGFSHRLPRRALLVTLDILRAASVVCLPFVTEVWQIYGLIFILSACSAGFTPTFQATIPDVLPEEDQYTRALSLSRLAYDLENLLSPTIAAMALLFLSYDALFTANAVSFIVSALLVLSVQLPSPQAQDRTNGIWHNTTYGIRAYLKTPRLRGLLAFSLAAASSGAMVIVNTVVYVRDTLGGSETDAAIAFAATGAGSMIVALSLPALLKKFPDRLFILSGGWLLVGGLLFGLTNPSLFSLLVLWFILGAGASLIQTPVGRLLMRSANRNDRPALYSAQFALSHLCWLIAYPMAGWLGATLGLTVTFSILATVALISTITGLILWPANDPIELEHTHTLIEHEHLHVHDKHHQHDHTKEDSTEPHSHVHRHLPTKHTHPYVIDFHHSLWPKP